MHCNFSFLEVLQYGLVLEDARKERELGEPQNEACLCDHIVAMHCNFSVSEKSVPDRQVVQSSL